ASARAVVHGRHGRRSDRAERVLLDDTEDARSAEARRHREAYALGGFRRMRLPGAGRWGLGAGSSQRRSVLDTRERYGASDSARDSLEPLRGATRRATAAGVGPRRSERRGAPRE